MIVCRRVEEIQTYRKQQGAKTFGFVPTMGALHQGHTELLRRAKHENEISILSIFVNPTQFNNPDDFTHYPKTWESDLEKAQEARVDMIFAPDPSVIYPEGFDYLVHEKSFSKLLCGTDREGHFDGVLTVVLKLFQIIQPTKAYFGEKDYQQLKLILGMVKNFFLPLQIVPVPTVRESDGLAMSSRNLRLTSEQRKIAPMLYQVLRTATDLRQAQAILSENGFRVVYLEEIQGRRFVAAFLGEVRLIDNIPWPFLEKENRSAQQ